MMSVEEEKERIQMTVLEESRNPRPSKGADAEKRGSETLCLQSGRSAGVLNRCTRPLYKFALFSVVIVILVLLLLLPTVLYHLLPLVSLIIITIIIVMERWNGKWNGMVNVHNYSYLV